MTWIRDRTTRSPMHQLFCPFSNIKHEKLQKNTWGRITELKSNFANQLLLHCFHVAVQLGRIEQENCIEINWICLRFPILSIVNWVIGLIIFFIYNIPISSYMPTSTIPLF